jgi:hypothetical protein
VWPLRNVVGCNPIEMSEPAHALRKYAFLCVVFTRDFFSVVTPTRPPRYKVVFIENQGY